MNERTKPVRAIVLPIIHMNGTCRAALVEELCAVYSAVNAALDTLRQAGPNGRDYYPVPGLMTQAEEQHRRRGAVLKELAYEIEEQVGLMDAIQDERR